MMKGTQKTGVIHFSNKTFLTQKNYIFHLKWHINNLVLILPRFHVVNN